MKLNKKQELMAKNLKEVGLKFDKISTYYFLCSPKTDLRSYGFELVNGVPFVYFSDKPLSKDHPILASKQAFSIGLASALSVLALDPKKNQKILDTCSAPGIKSLYLSILLNGELELCVNDISKTRLARLKRLFNDFGYSPAMITNLPAQSLDKIYQAEFDRIIIDAPCSGEGPIMAGKMKDTYYNRLNIDKNSQTQIKILKTATKLIKKDGNIIYSTCTLNRYENEKVLTVINEKPSNKMPQLSTDNLPDTLIQITKSHNVIYRLKPSKNNIGFTITRLQANKLKSQNNPNTYTN